MESGQSPQLKGFVIITLPPADNPSLGKTITAFTLSDSPPTPPQPSQPDSQLSQQSPIPTRSLPNPPRQLSLRISHFGNPRFLLGLLGISLAALILCFYASPNTLFELRDSNSNDDDRGPSSFVFPLYPKLGTSRQMAKGDVQLKLGGRFVRKDSVNLAAQLDDPTGLEEKAQLGSIHSAAILPVRGNIFPDGLYFTYMLLGSPPKPYYVDIDTGSDLTWIQCDAPCVSCAKVTRNKQKFMQGAHPLYNPRKGKIIHSKDSLCVEVQRNQKTGDCETCHQCDYELEYADQSSSMGVLARDDLHLMVANGSFTKSSVVFGCAYDQQGFLLNALAATDGILGLSRAKVSLPSQLASQGIINNVIGHCLTTDAGGGGYMFLGDGFVHYRQMAWVPLLNSPSTNFYQTEVIRMSYGHRKLSLGGQDNGLARVVFDSGSSYTYFTKQAYSDFLVSLGDVSSKGLVQDPSDLTLPVCWRFKFPISSVSDVKQFFKPLILQFGSQWWIVSRKLRILPEGYLIMSKKGNVCLGILDGSKVHDGSTVILGDISLRGQLIVYDNVNQKIGWAQSDCVKPHSFNSLPSFGGVDLPS
ncbi:hypothetical protein RHGRI_023862 [Rhododendron griersonianum]|uniref:Peptidase A1 domain-containing protein n=1 Tax=Rhododendron griersonianum TaxID=479676 RepID=A0AAV6J8C8_9ERIC|nr:hypothetical protein RHGRI_023862 [Rhododendron griersonianum]